MRAPGFHAPDEPLMRLAVCAQRLADEVCAQTGRLPRFLMPPEHATITQLAGCEVLPGRAQSGWLIALDDHGDVSAMATSDPRPIAWAPEELVLAVMVGGPLNGHIHQLPWSQRHCRPYHVTTYAITWFDDAPPGWAPGTGTYLPGESSADGYISYVWAGVR